MQSLGRGANIWIGRQRLLCILPHVVCCFVVLVWLTVLQLLFKCGLLSLALGIVLLL